MHKVSSICHELNARDAATREQLTTLVRQHWKRDSRCPKNLSKYRYSISKSPLALQLAEELVQTPEYQYHFGVNFSERYIEMLAELYKTQWRYHRDNNNRVPHAPAAVSSRKTKPRSSLRHEHLVGDTGRHTNTSSLCSSESEKKGKEPVKDKEQAAKKDFENLLLEAESLVNDESALSAPDPHSEGPTASSRVFGQDVDLILDECSKIEPRLGTPQLCTPNLELVCSLRSDESISTSASSTQHSANSESGEIKYEESLSIKINKIPRYYQGDSLHRAVCVFSEYLDRVNNEGGDVSVEKFTAMFHQVFGDYSDDPTAAEMIYGDGFV